MRKFICVGLWLYHHVPVTVYAEWGMFDIFRVLRRELDFRISGYWDVAANTAVASFAP